ncbi:hypothetical protein MIMGU_mgv11b024654mg [Erythranthe guttata]|uniref:Uncharacterized protein n=1 Tax=Erythranthe guttata TaxID=4155 RepID=A0A022Q8K1_ERYGU|nr:hypothetical protein MIMGU_mgv11b024654mg [Erythranthe guttata]
MLDFIKMYHFYIRVFGYCWDQCLCMCKGFILFSPGFRVRRSTFRVRRSTFCCVVSQAFTVQHLLNSSRISIVLIHSSRQIMEHLYEEVCSLQEVLEKQQQRQASNLISSAQSAKNKNDTG